MGYLKETQILRNSDLYLNALGEWQETGAYGSSIPSFESYGRYFRPVNISMPLQMRTLNWISTEDYTWAEDITVLAAVQYWVDSESIGNWDFFTANIKVFEEEAKIISETKWDIKDIDYFIKLTPN
jgi:hypothetical protein